MVLKISWRDGFFSQGFPTDLRNDNNKIDVTDFPRPLQLFSLTYKNLLGKTDFGYSPAMPLYMQFETGLEMSATMDILTPTDFVDVDAPVQVIDIDPDSPDYGTRYPLTIALTQEADQYRPQNLLQVRPVGKPLRENTTYALVVKREFAANATSVEPNTVLTALLKGRNPWFVNPLLLPGEALDARAAYAPLAQFISANNWQPEDVIGATVWTTGNASRYTRNVVEKTAQWQPAAPDTDWQLREETADYCVLESSWQTPVLQKGVIPYFTGGAIEYDEQGTPIVRDTRSTPIIITIPKQDMPQQGYPGLIATGAGNFGLGLALFYSIGETDVGAVIENVYLNVEPGQVVDDLFHPVWAMAELALSPANISLQSAKWLQAPESAPAAPHIMVVEGHYDEQVTLPMQRPFLISMGADFVNEELPLPQESQLLPNIQVAGYQQRWSPVTGNRDGRTVAFCRIWPQA